MITPVLCICFFVFLLAVAVALYARRKEMYVSQSVGPLDPGVVIRDDGSVRSKCYSCEAQSGVRGGVGKCLTCQGPRFRYLSETIIARTGSAENGACLGCRGAP